MSLICEGAVGTLSLQFAHHQSVSVQPLSEEIGALRLGEFPGALAREDCWLLSELLLQGFGQDPVWFEITTIEGPELVGLLGAAQASGIEYRLTRLRVRKSWGLALGCTRVLVVLSVSRMDLIEPVLAQVWPTEYCYDVFFQPGRSTLEDIERLALRRLGRNVDENHLLLDLLAVFPVVFSRGFDGDWLNIVFKKGSESSLFGVLQAFCKQHSIAIPKTL